MRTYTRPMAGWWRRNPFYLWYMLREASCVFITLYALILLAEHPLAQDDGVDALHGPGAINVPPAPLPGWSFAASMITPRWGMAAAEVDGISGSGFDWHDVDHYFRPNAIGRFLTVSQDEQLIRARVTGVSSDVANTDRTVAPPA